MTKDEKTIACFEHLFESNRICNYRTLEVLSERLPPIFTPDYQKEWQKISLPKGVDRLFYMDFLIEFVTSLDVENSDGLRNYARNLERCLETMLDERKILLQDIEKVKDRIKWQEQTLKGYNDELLELQSKLDELDKAKW